MKQALSRVWAPIDWLVEQVQNGIDTEVQQRVAMLCILISIPVGIAGPFLPEWLLQQLIYAMSAIALTLTGITWLAGLQSKKAAEENGNGKGTGAPPPPVP